LAAPTYSNPFHPEQCELAVAAGRRWTARAGQHPAGAAVLAEGLLCRGLEADDPWALQAALTALQARDAEDGGDFFAHLYAAEAVRRRYPLSDAAVAAFERAAAVLATADVGAARAELDRHLRQAMESLQAHRRQFLPLLQRRAAELEQGVVLPPSHLVDLLTLLAQSGPAGVGRALAVLDAHLAARHDVGLDTLQRAELLRGRDTPGAVAALYRSAQGALCSRPETGPEW
jgi:hypothetical protein